MNELSGACGSNKTKHVNKVNKTAAQERIKDWKHGNKGKGMNRFLKHGYPSCDLA